MPKDELPPDSAIDAVDEVGVGERYRIQPATRLPELDLGEAEAVAARDARNPGEVLFARVCSTGLPPRTDLMLHLRHMMDTTILRPLDWGPVTMPGSSTQRIAVVFRRPQHGPILASYKSPVPPLQAEDIARRVVRPITVTLAQFAQRGASHRSIRPENIYWDGAGRNSVILGDCVTAPPACTQPILFEPVESAVTPALGRGPGSVVDDFYALGVTVLILAMGRCPIAELSDRDILAAKMQKGSYNALMAGERPPFGLREFLRGLLADDPGERWGLEELEQWLGGGLRSTVQDARAHLAERPFKFAGVEYTNCRALANAFGEKWEQAAAAIRDQSFDKWLRRGVSDGTLAQRVAAAITSDTEAEGRNRASPRLVSRVCQILDRSGPLRYKGLVAMPSAFGTVLADASQRGDNKTVGLVAECITRGVALDWFAAQSGRMQLVYDNQMKEIRLMQQLLRHSGPGYGIERCLYMLNPYLHCRSALLGGRYVGQIKDLLPILEQIVARDGKLAAMFDRHLAAFIASRIKSNVDRLLSSLESRGEDGTGPALGVLGLFARIQSKFGPESLPHLTQWFARELESTIDRFHSRSAREQLRKRLNAVGESGSLIDLNNCINNETQLRRDETGRRQAAREYAGIAREISQLESREFQESAQRAGWRIASGIGGLIAAGTVAMVVMM
jgi:hypothetical protein